MANFGGSVSQLKIDEGAAIKSGGIKTQNFDFRGKADEDDFMSQLDKMTKAMREKQEQQADLKLGALDFGTGLIDETVAERPIDKLLREARELIAAEEYELATLPLSEILQQENWHHEAIYLLAYCQYELGDFDSALQVLLPLRRARLDNALATRVADLKENIRAGMFIPVVLENFVLMQTGLYDIAIGQLRNVVALDPEFGLYHFMLAGSLMEATRFQEALTAADDGLRDCGSADKQMLEGLRQQIERHYVAGLMAPARRLFKEGKYGKARSVLNRVDPVYRSDTLYVTFATYLARLDSGVFGFFKKKDPSTIVPEGRPKDIEAFYFFIVDEEISRSKRLIAEQRYGEAEPLMLEALRYTHNFPFTNYLYGGCVYSRLSQQVESGKPPALEEAILDIEDAHRHAKIGASDSQISDAVSLLGAIDDARQYLDSILKEVKAREGETRLVNGAIQEFESIMQSAGNGITSAYQYRSINERMNALKNKLPGIKKQLRSDDAKEVFKQIVEAIDRNCKQLVEIGEQVKESEKVEECFEKFTKKMESLKSGGGIKSSSDLRDAQYFFRSLKREAESAEMSVKSSDAKQSLDELIKAIDAILSQLGG